MIHFLTLYGLGQWLQGDKTWKTESFKYMVFLVYPFFFVFNAAFMQYSVFPCRLLLSWIFVFLFSALADPFGIGKIRSLRIACTGYVWYIAIVVYQYIVGFTHIVETFSY